MNRNTRLFKIALCAVAANAVLLIVMLALALIMAGKHVV